MATTQTGKYKRPEWHRYLWIPVGVCLVIAGLFLFGILPADRPQAVPEEMPTQSTPAPTQGAASTPTSTPPPADAAAPPAETPALEVFDEEQAAPPILYGKPLQIQKARCEATLTLDDNQRRIHGVMRTQFTNTTGDELYELVYHLHPNAFRTADSPGAQAESRSYPGGVFSRGEMIISSVSLNGQLSYFSLSADRLTLHVPFNVPLPPDGEAEVLMEFAVDVPEMNARFGYTQLGYQLGNFLPALAVYQDGAWPACIHAGIGDSFYSGVADYAVAFEYPEGYTFASTGEIVRETAANGMKTSYVEAKSARDFACALLKGVKYAEESINGVRVRAYALTDQSAQRAAALAKDALAMFARLIGDYPYETFTVMQAELTGVSGMEFTGFVMISRTLYLGGQEMELELTIAHELAHQYFFALVGSDPVNAPWIDEALTTYISMLPLESWRAGKDYDTLYARLFVDYAAIGGRIDAKLPDYENEGDYSASVYWGGGAMYAKLREELGDDVFFAAIQDYVKTNARRIATKADIISAFEKASGRELEDYFENALAGQQNELVVFQ